MSNRLGGKQGTAYTGTNADQPPNMIFETRSPGVFDTQNVSLGDIWLNTVDKLGYMLVAIDRDNDLRVDKADWRLLSQSLGDLNSLTGNSGGPIPSDDDNNINIIGSGAITVTGDPGTNTLEITADSSVPVEGSWVPGINFDGSSTGVTYGTRTGRFIKIGKLVFIKCLIEVTSKGTDTGEFNISPLPFPRSISPGRSMLNIMITGLTGLSGNSVLSFTSQAVTTRIKIVDATAGVSWTQVLNTQATDTMQIYLSGTYKTN